MRKPEIITYKGKTVIYIDFTNMKDKDEIMKLEKEGSDLIRSHALNSVYTLTNMEGMFFNNELKKWFEEIVKINAPHVRAGAVIGMTGFFCFNNRTSYQIMQKQRRGIRILSFKISI